jgi:hypothetical protein
VFVPVKPTKPRVMFASTYRIKHLPDEALTCRHYTRLFIGNKLVFVPAKPTQLSVMFASTYRIKHLLAASLYKQSLYLAVYWK